VIDVPAFTNQKLLNPAVSITPVATGKCNRPLSECFIEGTLTGAVPLCSPLLRKQKTRSPLRDWMLLSSLCDRPALADRAYQFPEAKSFKTALSKDKSATKRLSLPFSFSSSFNRFAWPVVKPPYSFLQR